MSTSTTEIDYSLYGGADSLDEGRSPRRTVVIQPSNTDDGVKHLGPIKDPKDYLWLMTEEPHRSRRLAIMKAHPEVTTLMGHTTVTKWVVLGVVSLQFSLAFYLARFHPISWPVLAVAYVIGGTANQNLFLAIHEITHNLAAKGLWTNRLLAVLANLPIGVPYAAAFKKYHIEHHKHLGEDGIDTDIPMPLEILLLDNVLGKTFFATFQIFFYALRPGFVRAQTLTPLHFINVAAQLIVNYLIVQYVGWRPLLYLLFSSFFAGSLHPMAGHFIAEHYLWDGSEQETFSYYGWLNIFAYNVGYHNEHHDFPAIPWTRLPALKAMAPEFYDTLPSHPSWPMVIWNFIRDPEVGLHARAKRASKLVSAKSR